MPDRPPTLAELYEASHAVERNHGHRDQDRHAASLGRRPSTAARCPRVIAGLRCHAWRREEPCPCQAHHQVLDHARVWLDGHGRRILTAEPYGATGEDIAALTADCHALGLRVDIAPESPWFPLRTLMVEVTREDR